MFEEELEKAINCDALFNGKPQIYKQLEEIALRSKDILEVCSPETIAERIRQENDLRAIDNARGVLLGFYRSYYPINTSKEERRKLLQKNPEVKKLINALNANLEQCEATNSKRLLVETLIKNLDGTYF